jgi:hypothetical protein
MVVTRALVVAVLLGFAACSSGSSTGPTITTFTATPSSLPTAGGSVRLAWNVTGATALSINQNVGPVTPLTTGSTTVQVTAATTFTLTATDASGSSTATAAVTVAAPIAVSGTVVDNNTPSQPSPGQTVVITSGTFSQSVVTDANGAFSVSAVPTPYTATILDVGGTSAFQYQGLTRPDPTLTDLVALQAQSNSAVLSGMLTGGSYPEGSGYSTVLTFASPQTTVRIGDVPSGSYSDTLSWGGPTTTAGVLYGLQIHTVAGLPADYPGYGTLPSLSLENTETLSGQNVALSAVTAGTLSGTVTPPAGYTVGMKTLLLIAGSGSSATDLQLLTDSSGSGAFNYTTPSIPDTSLSLEAIAAAGTGEASIVLMGGLSANGSGVSVTIPPALQLTVPVTAATGVTVSTPFTWTANANGISILYVHGGGSPEFYVFTSGTTATIPDLSSVGLPLPASAAYTWEVIGLGPFTTVDGAAGPGGINALLLGSFNESLSASRTFTTSP